MGKGGEGRKVESEDSRHEHEASEGWPEPRPNNGLNRWTFFQWHFEREKSGRCSPMPSEIIGVGTSDARSAKTGPHDRGGKRLSMRRLYLHFSSLFSPSSFLFPLPQ